MKSNLNLAAVALALAGIFGNAYSAPAGFSAGSFSCDRAADSGSVSGNGAGGVNTSAGDGIQCGNNRVLLASSNVAGDSYYFQPSRSAVATPGRHDPVVADTGNVSKPETFTLVLAGLGLMGFIARRRMQQQ